MRKLIILSAPSGAGKTTLCSRLLADFPHQLVLSVSCTTRKPRGKERDGREYYFISIDEFQGQIRAGRFAEWANVHGNYYGTSKDLLDQSLAEGKAVLLDIDVQGAESLRKAYPAEAVSVFISPPDLDTLEKRLRARATESEETIQKRLKNAKEEMKQAPKFHHVVINDDLEQAYAKLRELVGSELGTGPH